MTTEPSPPKRALLKQLFDEGINDLDVLAAIQTTPRELFVPERYQSNAYENRPLPIGRGQTISQPSIIALMTSSLELSKSHRVLEIGTGSGYQAAILARLAGEVFTIERHPDLAEQAKERLASLGLDNVHVRVGDGTLGWPEEAPFDRMMVTAAGPRVPASLVGQLTEGGRVVIPIHSPGEENQRLYLFVKHGEELEPTLLSGCRFVPLLGEEGWPTDHEEPDET